MFSVPPLPPSNGFDVRFEDDSRYAVSGGELTVLNDSYPLRISFTFPDRSLDENWILVNNQTGEEYPLSSQDELLIETSLSTMTLKKVVPGIPVEFALHPAYPNPFNPVTTLRYDIPEGSWVKLDIYDMMGKHVKQLVDGRQEAGYKSVTWDATDDFSSAVSAGVYLFRLRSGEFTRAGKVIMLK